MQKQRLLALFTLSLSAAWGACSPSGIDNPMDGDGDGSRKYTVSFEKNCTDSMEEFARKKLTPPTRIVEDFPENPSCPGHRFVEWNTARDGSGTPFTAQTPIPSNEILVIVYAKWVRTQLSVEVFPSTLPFSPMTTGSYGGNSATLSVVVSGLVSSDDANGVELSLENPEWLSLAPPLVSVSGGTKTFKVNVSYPGTAFDKEPAQIRLGLANVPKEYEHDNTPRSIRIVMGDGQIRPIPVTQANIQDFNEYANKPEGLNQRYQLVENVVLEAPAAPKTSNWEAIGRYDPLAADPLAETFTGSFDGDGHTISGLVIDSSEDCQGLFGVISGANAEIKSLGLVDVSVKGNNVVGGLAGFNGGTVENSYATGSIEGKLYVGGLLGINGINFSGTVENSYATGNVEGGGVVGGLVGRNDDTVKNSHATSSVEGEDQVGGLVGGNHGRVENSYATGNVEGDSQVGGLMGLNYGTVLNSYATGSVEGTGNIVGGLVGQNNGGRVENSYATGSVEGNGIDRVGGLVGQNYQGTVQNSYATGSVKGSGRNVGGLIGEHLGGIAENCVALNPSVIASGTSIGRVVGHNISGTTMTNNHAREDMDIRYGVTDSSSGTKKTIANNGRGDSGGVDGQSVSSGSGGDQYGHFYFWTNTMHWVFDDTHWYWNSTTQLPILQKVGVEQNHRVQ